jgi:hypothetical protein
MVKYCCILPFILTQRDHSQKIYRIRFAIKIFLEKFMVAAEEEVKEAILYEVS